MRSKINNLNLNRKKTVEVVFRW